MVQERRKFIYGASEIGWTWSSDGDFLGIIQTLIDSVTGGNTLYFAGCLTNFGLEKTKKNYELILKKCGIDFVELGERERCCGSPVKKAGYPEDYERLKKGNKAMFREYGVKRMVFSCPTCYDMLKSDL